MLFIIGSGRTGTHWVADLLQSHSQCSGLIEAEPIFSYATALALNPGLSTELLPKLIEECRAEAQKRSPKIFFDKSHPNIWQAEALLAAFPEARFIGIQRSVFGTVASMLKHGGVQHWIEHWRDYPLPNRFLGIDADNQDAYGSLSVAAQCALRWKSHHRRMLELSEILGDRLLIVNYESLQDDPASEVERLRHYLNLDAPFPTPEIKKSSRDQWQSQLNDDEIDQIRHIALS